MAGEPEFAIPVRPERTYPYSGSVEYEGETVFRLSPSAEYDTARVEEIAAAVLSAGPYRYGDFLNLPMALYLVRDDETGDVFRLAVRDGELRLHVMPATDPAGLRAFYDRVDDRTEADWTVECQASEAERT